MTKNEKRIKTKICFFNNKIYLLFIFFFAYYIEGLKFLKNILVLSGNFCVFFYSICITTNRTDLKWYSLNL